MKRIIGTFVFLALTSFFIAADIKADFNSNLSLLISDINTSLPDNAVIGGTWSDAYIGQLLGVPPHFGIGVASGVSSFPLTGLKKTLETVGIKDLPMTDMLLPNFGVEARIGGIILPFDIGIRYGMLPKMTIQKTSFEYLHFAGDIRYAILKGNVVLPKLSAGIGYYYTKGSIGYTFNPGALLDVDPAYTAAIGDQKLGIDFETGVIELKAQVSKSLAIITPYAGLGLSLANSKGSYIVASEKGTKTESIYGARVFGGFSLNALIARLDLTGSYNFLSQNWGANLGARIQL